MINLLCVLDDLYDSELNFEMGTFWDSGYTVRLGDPSNGFIDEWVMLDSLDEVARAIISMVNEHYPDSDFAKKYA